MEEEMKIRPTDSEGRPEPQFIVEAETETDTMILKMFLMQESKKNLEFKMHGLCYQNGKYKSFNFGWRELKGKK